MLAHALHHNGVAVDYPDAIGLDRLGHGVDDYESEASEEGKEDEHNERGGDAVRLLRLGFLRRRPAGHFRNIRLPHASVIGRISVDLTVAIVVAFPWRW